MNYTKLLMASLLLGYITSIPLAQAETVPSSTEKESKQQASKAAKQSQAAAAEAEKALNDLLQSIVASNADNEEMFRCLLDKETPQNQQVDNSASSQPNDTQQVTTCDTGQFMMGMGGPALRALRSALEEDLAFVDGTSSGGGGVIPPDNNGNTSSGGNNPGGPGNAPNPGLVEDVVQQVLDTVTPVTETTLVNVAQLLDNNLDHVNSLLEDTLDFAGGALQTPLPVNTLGETVGNLHDTLQTTAGDIKKLKGFLHELIEHNVTEVLSLRPGDGETLQTLTDLVAYDLAKVEQVVAYLGTRGQNVVDIVPLQTLVSDLGNTTDHLNQITNTYTFAVVGHVNNIQNTTLEGLTKTLQDTFTNLSNIADGTQGITETVLAGIAPHTGITPVDNAVAHAFDELANTTRLVTGLLAAMGDKGHYVTGEALGNISQQVGKLQQAAVTTQREVFKLTGSLLGGTNNAASHLVSNLQDSAKNLQQNVGQGAVQTLAFTRQVVTNSLQNVVNLSKGDSMNLLLAVNLSLSSKPQEGQIANLLTGVQASLGTDNGTNVTQMLDAYLESYAGLGVSSVGGKLDSVIDKIRNHQSGVADKLLPSLGVNVSSQTALKLQPTNLQDLARLREQVRASIALNNNPVVNLTTIATVATQPVTNAVSDVAEPVVGAVASVVQPVTSGVATTVENVTQPVGGAVAAVTTPVTTTVAAATTPVVNTVTTVTQPVTNTVAAVTQPVTTTVAAVVAPVTAPVTPVVNTVAAVTAPVTPVVTTVTAPVTPVVQPIVNTVAAITTPVANNVVAPVVPPVVAPITAPVVAPVIPVMAPVVAPVIDIVQPVVAPIAPITQPVGKLIGGLLGGGKK